MKQAWRWLLVAAALVMLPNAALAQKRPKKGQQAPAPAPAAGGEIELDAPAAPAPAPGAPGAAAPAPGDTGAPAATPPGDTGAPPAGGVGGGICEIDPTACPKAEDISKAAKKDVNAEVYAVQQIYTLRYHRLEVNPWWNVTLNDQFVSHPGPGLGLNFYITNVLAAGVSGNYYGATASSPGLNTDSDFNLQNRRSARIAVPLTDYLAGWNVNLTYVPIYGKFAGFSNFIFSYDAYILGGVGMIWTKPEAVIDPDNRKFSYGGKLDFDFGIGLRIFFSRWFALNLEIRDYIYNEQLESTTIPLTAQEQQDSKNWYGASSLTNNVQAQVGVSIFLPFSWEYRLPK